MIIITILILMPLLFLIVGIYYTKNRVKNLKNKVECVESFNENLVSMWNKFIKSGKLDDKLYKYTILNSKKVTKNVNCDARKIYKFGFNTYNGINLINDGIPYIKQYTGDKSIRIDVLQEIVLDIDNRLTAAIGAFKDEIDEQQKFKTFKLISIGYSKVYEEIVDIFSVNYLKLKANIIKKLLGFIYTIIFIWKIIEFFI
jgi:hypothetical protein